MSAADRDAGRALVLFSGGQDSTVALASALTRFAHVETIGFDYGQRHGVELQQRVRVLAALRSSFPDWNRRLGDDRVLVIPALKALGETAMTEAIAIETTAAGLPSTFVPGRNLLFFTYAAALAYRRGIATLVGGMSEADYSGYPDCRHATLEALARALTLGLDRRVEIDAPLMRIDKAGTFALAETLGGQALVDIIVEETHTCYLADRTQRHAWGYGCGTCPACMLRAKGWAEWQTAKA